MLDVIGLVCVRDVSIQKTVQVEQSYIPMPYVQPCSAPQI